MKNIIMTLNGLNILKKKLKFLKEVCRPKIIKSIIESRKFGDLKENYEYRIAIEQQNLCEKKIKYIEKKLLNINLLDLNKNKIVDTVCLGSCVKLENLSLNKFEIYNIVGDEESNIKKSKISIYSPIAKGIIGKKKDDIINIKIPLGIFIYKIINIK